MPDTGHHLAVLPVKACNSIFMEKMVEEDGSTFETVYALIKRRDAIYDETGEDPLADNFGTYIKAAGMLRDQIDPADRPSMREIDPDEVFGDG